MEGPVSLYRCFSCLRLTHTRLIQKHGKCRHCGERKVRGASPASIFEKIQVLWWELTVR